LISIRQQYLQHLPHFADLYVRVLRHLASDDGLSHGELSPTGASNPDGTAAIAAISQESRDSHSYHFSHRRCVEHSV
jgi:hypothetical protein